MVLGNVKYREILCLGSNRADMRKGSSGVDGGLSFHSSRAIRRYAAFSSGLHAPCAHDARAKMKINIVRRADIVRCQKTSASRALKKIDSVTRVCIPKHVIPFHHRWHGRIRVYISCFTCVCHCLTKNTGVLHSLKISSSGLCMSQSYFGLK